jgi:transmembrane sensor
LPLRRPAAARWIAGIAVAAVLTLSLYLMTGSLLGPAADQQTAVGEQRTVTLADGSTVYLNTDSALSTEFSPTLRRVTLLKGDAIFAVSPDQTRPFRVESGGVTATALGTEFLVRRHDARVTVAVLEHRVSIAAAAPQQGPASAQSVTLEPGQQVAYDPRGGLGHVRQVDLAAAAAWRRGKVIFEGEPLGSVINELNRYHRGRILIIDPQVRAMRVNGVFQTADPAAVVTALEHTLAIHSTRLTDYIILLHR